MIIYGFNLSSFDISMLSICGVLIMALVGYRLTLSAQKHNAFIAAASVFKSKVTTELEEIYSLPAKWPQGTQIEAILRSKFPKLQSAVEEFKLYLPERKQRIFTDTWVKYYNVNGDDRCQCYHHYMSFEDNPNYKENFKHNVAKLLSFAK